MEGPLLSIQHNTTLCNTDKVRKTNIRCTPDNSNLHRKLKKGSSYQALKTKHWKKGKNAFTVFLFMKHTFEIKSIYREGD